MSCYLVISWVQMHHGSVALYKVYTYSFLATNSCVAYYSNLFCQLCNLKVVGKYILFFKESNNGFKLAKPTAFKLLKIPITALFFIYLFRSLIAGLLWKKQAIYKKMKLYIVAVKTIADKYQLVLTQKFF